MYTCVVGAFKFAHVCMHVYACMHGRITSRHKAWLERARAAACLTSKCTQISRYAGQEILESLNKHAKVECGYTAIEDVVTMKKR